MSERPLAPAHIARIAPYQPGKPIEELKRELGDAWPAEGAIKLASNENPLGTSQKVIAAIAQAAAAVSRYPDAGSFALRDRLSRHLGVGRDRLMIGSGSNEIINLIVQAFVAEGEEVLTPKYQFICYRLAAEAMGRTLREADNGADYALDAEALLKAVTPATKVVFLANPNNPTGTHMGKAALERVVTQLPKDIVLVLDEAYLEYVDAADYASAATMMGKRDRLIVLRTFSKIYGLAGLRVGYAIAHEPIIEMLNRIRLAFNVSNIAHAAAIAALDDAGWVERTRAQNTQERARLVAELERRGLHVTPSQCNFVLCSVPSGFTGPTYYDALLSRGVIVRPLMPYAMPNHVRISVGTSAENERLLVELDRVNKGR